MSIRLITFDLDDTLWDVAPVMHGAEAALRDWLGEHAPRLGPVPIEHLWAIRKRVMAEDPSLRHRMSELRRRILLLALQEAGYVPGEARDLAEAAFQIFLSARHQVSFFPDVQSTLEQLANRYILGVLTNGNADVRRLGLADYFQFALCAEELGVGKPDPHPFEQALARAGVPAEQALHVGDHPADDILGARGAGMHAVWYNPQGKPWQLPDARPGMLSSGLEGADPKLLQRCQPSAEIRSLGELPGLLQRW
ncbi:HAD family hydrolase [Pseudomonas mangrovi]|jgi:HAD superfamily hydrolase (TIGR01509 family)|uniref:HAD family hydrolase n=1 Tax=Pseudomonas mangrovi TaxID=2161748 RepID=A0A2T5P5L8_9PSED|nr:HAD family hydrolase [Pseudomonas mangrovi]PTU72977.1 HAD family hydrolase [Pseudomonas mangrovi]